MKKHLVILVILFAFTALMPTHAEVPLRIGVVLSIGGLNDESFNDAAYKGIMQLRQDEKCIVEVVEPGNLSGIEPALRYFCERKMDLVCAVGIFANDAVRKVASDYPASNFLLIDSVVTVPNVLSILFDEEQGSFFAGAFAALLTKTKTIGFLGGMDSPIIATFERGFKNGIKFVNPEIKVTSRYIGSTPEAFDMADKARILGISMASEGADIIYHASGKSGIGLIEASRRNNYYVIGVDSDQSRTAPGKVPASMVKRIDNALIKAVQILRRKSFEGGIWTLGIKDKGIELAVSRFNRDLITPEIETKIKEIENFLIHRGQ